MRLKMETRKQDRFDGYTVNVFLDDDGEYLAHFVEMPNVSAFGESLEEALSELATAWEGVKESYQKHCDPFPLHPRGGVQRTIQCANRSAVAPCSCR
jgi:predicted RNase H-like HicB family nuclease